MLSTDELIQTSRCNNLEMVNALGELKNKIDNFVITATAVEANSTNDRVMNIYKRRREKINLQKFDTNKKKRSLNFRTGHGTGQWNWSSPVDLLD